jgi:shikimate kinase
LVSKPKNIILVGFMASGKSHVGRLLSGLTGWPLLDADEEIKLRSGKPISVMFTEDGEPHFRKLERSVIRDLCVKSRNIIAAGGGAFVDAENRQQMLNNGLVICLRALPATIHQRLTAPASISSVASQVDPVRPLLAGGAPLERIESLLAQRAEAYNLAHMSIDTDNLTPEQVARQILVTCGSSMIPEGE